MGFSPRVILRRGRESSLLDGHLWVYAGHLAEVRGSPSPGEVVDVSSAAGGFLGRGFYNPHSQIRVRLLTPEEEPIDEAFLDRRLGEAAALRRLVVSDTTAHRMVFGEGDRLPGLIVDRYGDVLVMQTLSYGMDLRKEALADLLVARTGAHALYLRNDTGSRSLEGLARHRGYLREGGGGASAPTRIEIVESGARFLVEIERGQKTGWFCDQRENRLAAAPLASGGEVLDAFCYTGAFGIHAALAGARSVLGLESSGEAVALARANASLNGLGARCEFRQADAFDGLRELAGSGRLFDLVALDPPAFAKNKAALARAAAGYKEVNLQAVRLLRPGGFLVTSSCSFHMGEAAFFEAVAGAARDAGRRLRLLEARSQARDHPVLVGMPETRYLKCLVLQVL